MPTLREVIDLAIEAGCGLYVEVKERAAALPTLRLLSASAVPFAAVGSFDHDTVRDLAAARQGASALSHLGSRSRRRRPVHGRRRYRRRGRPSVLGAGIEMRPTASSRRILSRARRAKGSLVVIWHEERRAVLDRLMTLPVVGICTDKPGDDEPIGAASGLSDRRRLPPRHEHGRARKYLADG